MHRYSLTLTLLSLLLLVTESLAFPTSADAEELSSVLEEVEGGVFHQIDSFTVGTCDPACPGQICCNGACVSTVLACANYPILPDSFGVHGSPRAQMAGYATQGVLAAEYSKEARLFFGNLDGEGWSHYGIDPGYYELVLQEGSTMNHAVVAVVDRSGSQVARLGGHFWVFSSATDTATDTATKLDWELSPQDLEFRACYDGNCVQLILPLSLDG